MRDNVLTDIAWVKTDRGLKTVEDVLKNAKSLKLETQIPAYEFGSQLRFLMTIFALVIQKADGYKNISENHIDDVLVLLEPHSHLLDEYDPFLQMPKRLFKDTSQILKKNKNGVEELNSAALKTPAKLLPAEPNGKQEVFWDFEDKTDFNTSVEQAVLLLVAAYLYKSGGNFGFEPGVTAKNSASALRYVDTGKLPPAIEIIPLGANLFDTLVMSIPKEYITPDNVLPHWADRESLVTNPQGFSPLWRFTWSFATTYCVWGVTEDDAIVLKSVGVGATDAFLPKPVFTHAKDQWKEFDATRKAQDPFYFYYLTDKGESKMYYANLSGEPHYYVARWNADALAEKLISKWRKNIRYSDDKLDNLLFLEQATGGTAQSFTIRHSKSVLGWRDEMLPNGNVEKIDEVYGSVLDVRNRLTGFFSENGTMKHLATKRADVDTAFWNEFAPYIAQIASGELKAKGVKRVAKKVALEALNTVSSKRDTIHISAHLKAENILGALK